MAKKHLARGKNANFEEEEDESRSTKLLFKSVCLFRKNGSENGQARKSIEKITDRDCSTEVVRGRERVKLARRVVGQEIAGMFPERGLTLMSHTWTGTPLDLLASQSQLTNQ